MSWSPCSNCRSTANGALRFCYIAVFEKDIRKSHRARLCNACWEALVDELLACCEIQDAVGRWLAQEERL